MKLKNKREIITGLILLIALVAFLSGVLAGISLQQNYAYNARSLELAGNRTCMTGVGVGYCRQIAASDCGKLDQMQINYIYEAAPQA